MVRCFLQTPKEITAKTDRYIVRITGDSPVARGYLDYFINPEEDYPVIATTSKLMTTGTDAQTCKVIVLDTNISSKTEFKQIIGRGTRINEEYGKHYFTIIDFRNVTDLFAEKDFDGDPVKIKKVDQDEPLCEEENDDTDDAPISGNEPEEYPDTGDSGVMPIVETEPPYNEPKEKVRVAGVDVQVLTERIQFIDNNGKLITTSVKDYIKNGVVRTYRSLDKFLQTWNEAEKKQAIIDELEKQGLILDNLKEETKSDLDVFDLICHIAWDAPALTRKERANNVRKRNYWTKYGEQARKVLNTLLDKYAEQGIAGIENLMDLTIEPMNQFGTAREIFNIFGGKEAYLAAIRELEAEIYKSA